MCFFNTPSIPDPPAPPPRRTGKEATEARERTRAAAALAQGRSSTILTSGLGLTTKASSATKGISGVS